MIDLDAIELRRLVLRQAVAGPRASFAIRPCGSMCDHKPIDQMPDLFICRECKYAMRWKDWIYSPQVCRRQAVPK
jgi:hypothetical protein